MSEGHVRRFVVPAAALDDDGHVNNVVYLEWVQRAASDHADACGCTGLTAEAGAVWVVREHRVRYRRSAFAGDELEVRTWVESVARFTSLRRTEIRRLPEREIVVRAWTDWAFLDRGSGRPREIPAGIATALGAPPPVDELR